MAKFLKDNPIQPDVRNIFSSPTEDKAYRDRNCEHTANVSAEIFRTNTGVQSCVKENNDTENNNLSLYCEGKITSIDTASDDIYSYAYGNGRMRYLSEKICSCQQNTYLSLGHNIGNVNKEKVECSICRSQAVTTVKHTDTISIYGETVLFQDWPQTSTCPRKSQYDNRKTNEQHDIHRRNTTDESRDTYMTPVSTSGIVGDFPEYDQVDDNHLISLSQTSNGSSYYPAKIPEADTKAQSVCNRCRIILTIIIVVTIIAAVVIPVVLVRVNNTPAPDCINCHLLSCPSYPAQLHGTVNDTADVLPSSAVSVSCTSGYMLNGSSVVRCLSNGTWEFISSCIPKNCGRYKTPPHASLATDNVDATFNTTLRVVCDDGYMLAENSSSFVTCSENGNWTRDPICLNQVHLTVSDDTIYIGGRAEISCSVTKAPGWTSLIVGRTNPQNSSKNFVLIQKTVSYYNTSPIPETHIRLSNDPKLEEDFAFIKLVFEPVQCTDALGKAGNISFFCEVQYKNTILRDQNNARIIHRPTPPRMKLTPKIVEAQDTGLFWCKTEFPEPNGHIEIQTDLHHSGVFEPILTTSRGEYKTDIAWIEDLKYTEEDCSFHVKVEFGIKNISIPWHRSQLRCVSYPSEISTNKSILASEVGLIKVIPGDVCTSSKTDQFISHPYNCSLIVECKGGVFSNIQSGCLADQCFDAASNQCPLCSLVGGCSLTDIYFEVNNSRRNSFIEGSTALIVCMIESFKGLTDIRISRRHGELVGSFRNGSNLRDFSIIQERSYLNSGTGSLVGEINPLKCADQTTYWCVPYGNGKNSTDVATLQLQGC